MTSRPLVVAISTLLLTGCPRTSAHPDAGVDAGAHDASDADAGSSDAGAGPQVFTLTFPTWTVTAGGEQTRCVVLDLGNPAPVSIGSVELESPATTYEFELYADSVDAAEPTPFDCEPFVSLGRAGVSPLVFSNRPTDLVTLPDDVAFSLTANQKLLLVLHTRNHDLADASAGATVTLTERPGSTHHAGLLVFTSPDVDVGAGQLGSLDFFATIDASLAGSTQFFALAGYQHGLGTSVSVATGVAGASETAVYEVEDVRSAPDWRADRTPFSIPAGAGLRIVCAWDNIAGATPVRFGAAASEEICAVGAYYLEAGPLNVCVRTSQFGGLDVCCPGPTASALCDSLF